MTSTYWTPPGGLPSQSRLISSRAVFTDAYALIPNDSLTDIVTSSLPFWNETRLWVLARPMTGFSETFSHYLMEVAPGGGSDRPDDDHQAQNVIFVVGGQLRITLGDQSYNMDAGGYVYIPAACDWNIRNSGSAIAHFHWIRKRYVSMDGVNQPKAFVTSDNEIKPTPMPNSSGLWSTSRFVDPCDLSHDMHVNIVTFQPGGTIPFAETHVMEHGLFILSGKGVYYLNQEWIEVEAGDFLWLRAFCPQACYAGGNSPFRYLLYKDVNRHAPLQILNR